MSNVGQLNQFMKMMMCVLLGLPHHTSIHRIGQQSAFPFSPAKRNAPYLFPSLHPLSVLCIVTWQMRNGMGGVACWGRAVLFMWGGMGGAVCWGRGVLFMWSGMGGTNLGPTLLRQWRAVCVGWNGSHLAEAVTCCLCGVERILPCWGSEVLSVWGGTGPTLLRQWRAVCLGWNGRYWPGSYLAEAVTCCLCLLPSCWPPSHCRPHRCR